MVKLLVCFQLKLQFRIRCQIMASTSHCLRLFKSMHRFLMPIVPNNMPNLLRHHSIQLIYHLN